MQDEHFIRDWNDSHDAFSAGVTRILSKAPGSDGEPVSARGTQLRYAHAHRLFSAIATGVIVGLLVASAAMIASATPSGESATEAAPYRVALQ